MNPRRLILMVVVAAPVLYLLYQEYPAMKRYLNISRM